MPKLVSFLSPVNEFCGYSGNLLDFTRLHFTAEQISVIQNVRLMLDLSDVSMRLQLDSVAAQLTVGAHLSALLPMLRAMHGLKQFYMVWEGTYKTKNWDQCSGILESVVAPALMRKGQVANIRVSVIAGYVSLSA